MFTNTIQQSNALKCTFTHDSIKEFFTPGTLNCYSVIQEIVLIDYNDFNGC